jgi:hypothetical protein
MRIEQPWSRAACTTSRTRCALPMLPGLMRRRAGLGRLDGAAVVEMDVGHDRNVHLAHDVVQRRRALLVGTGNPDNVHPRRLGKADLRHRGRHVAGERVGHGLHGDRGVAAHGHRTDMDLTRPATLNVLVRAIAHGKTLRVEGFAAQHARLHAAAQTGP